MPSVPISIESLDGGMALKAINEAIEDMNQDVINRPFLMAPRTLTFKYQIIPSKKSINQPIARYETKCSKPGVSNDMTALIRDGQIKILSETVQPELPGMEEAVQNNLEKINAHLAESGATLSVVTK